MRERLVSFILLAGATAILLNGCGKSDKNNVEQSQPPVQTEEAQNMESQQTNGVQTEVMIVRDAVGSIEIPQNPERIVDLTGNSDALAILGYSVVETEDKNAMDIEAVKNCNPDLILISTAQEKMYAELLEIAPTVMLRFDLMDWEDNAEEIARVFGKEVEMDSWLETYEKKAEEAGKEIKRKNGEEATYLSVLISDEELFVFSETSLGSVLYEDMDLEDPVGLPEQETTDLPVVTYEELKSIKADYLLVFATKEDMEKLEADTGWKSIPAVKEGKVLVLEPSIYDNYGYSVTGREILIDKVLELFQ